MGPQRAALRKRALRPRFVIKAPGASKRRKGHGQLHYSRSRLSAALISCHFEKWQITCYSLKHDQPTACLREGFSCGLGSRLE